MGELKVDLAVPCNLRYWRFYYFANQALVFIDIPCGI
jgi:hypothetical protein